ncbi:MAG: DUF433 domain-containing protein [Tepidisphaeraceae bacterium]
MTTAVVTPHIVIDENGRARIAGTRSTVANVVMDTMNGLTPEAIHDAYPHLSMAQIHAALAYYYDHQPEMDAEIEQGLREYDKMVADAGAKRTRTPRAQLERRLRENKAARGDAS